MRHTIAVMLMLSTAAGISQPSSVAASPSERHHRSLRSIYPSALHYGWRWVLVPTAVGARRAGLPFFIIAEAICPDMAQLIPITVRDMRLVMDVPWDYHFQDGFCYPN